MPHLCQHRPTDNKSQPKKTNIFVIIFIFVLKMLASESISFSFSFLFHVVILFSIYFFILYSYFRFFAIFVMFCFSVCFVHFDSDKLFKSGFDENCEEKERKLLSCFVWLSLPAVMVQSCLTLLISLVRFTSKQRIRHLFLFFFFHSK